jgi:hypothetical protein
LREDNAADDKTRNHRKPSTEGERAGNDAPEGGSTVSAPSRGVNLKICLCKICLYIY